jgi:hypothetical protein
MIPEHRRFSLLDEEECSLLCPKYLHLDSKLKGKPKLFQIMSSKPSELECFLSYLEHSDRFQVLWTYTMSELYLLRLLHEAYSAHYYSIFQYSLQIPPMCKLRQYFPKMMHSEEGSSLHLEFLNLSSQQSLLGKVVIYFSHIQSIV